MLSIQHVPFITLYPSWLFSPAGSSWEYSSLSSEEAVVAKPKPPRHSHILAPQPFRPSSILHRVAVKRDAAPKHYCLNVHTDTPSPPHSDDSWSSHSSSPAASRSASSSSSDRRLNLPVSAPVTSPSGRVALPLPFSPDQVENTVTFTSRHGKGVSLAEWAKLSEKRKTHLALAHPDERLDEFLPDDAKILFQCHVSSEVHFSFSSRLTCPTCDVQRP